MAKLFFPVFFCVALQMASAAELKKPEITANQYHVFRGDGTPASLDDVVAAAQKATVTFLGENHDDPVGHYLELQLLQRLAANHIALSLEMFERDVQNVVNEYLAGLITQEHLISSGRAWGNYKTDYRPLIEYAKEHHLPVIAANAPRRYVNRVSRMGKDSLDALDTQAKASLPPLPYSDASPAYTNKFQKLMEEMQKEQAKSAPPKPTTPAKDGKTQPSAPAHDPRWDLQAQSLWDASMADSIAKWLDQHPDGHVLQMNGSFHSEQHMGIPEHLLRYRPSTTTLVVTMRPDKSFPNWNGGTLANLGDFVIVTDPVLSEHKEETPKKNKKHGLSSWFSGSGEKNKTRT